jgi:hypothetical protein
MGAQMIAVFTWILLWIIIIIETLICLFGISLIIWSVCNRIKDERQEKGKSAV